MGADPTMLMRDMLKIIDTTYEEVVSPYPTAQLAEDLDLVAKAAGEIGIRRGYTNAAAGHRYSAALCAVAACVLHAHYQIHTKKAAILAGQEMAK